MTLRKLPRTYVLKKITRSMKILTQFLQGKGSYSCLDRPYSAQGTQPASKSIQLRPLEILGPSASVRHIRLQSEHHR